MPANVESIVKKFAEELKTIFPGAVDSIIVFGSYARGDYTDLSDVDIMVLVSLSEEEICKRKNTAYDLAFDYLMESGIDFSVIIKNVKHFNKWANQLPFYRNVKREGIKIA